jgi:probable selenate reductase FAD-binding subunit
MIESFLRPKSIREAVRLKNDLKSKGVFLAGGTFVNSKDFPGRVERVISLAGLGLDGVETKGGAVTLGALVTLQRLVEHRSVPPFLKQALLQIVSRNIRNAATIGGHVARNKSCSDLIPMLFALDARVEVAGLAGGAKKVPIAEYAGGRGEGLVTRIVIPKIAAGRLAACRTLRASSNSTSILSAAVSFSLRKTKGIEVVEDSILALGGVARSVVRLSQVEERLDGRPLPPAEEIEELVRRGIDPILCRGKCLTSCLPSHVDGSTEFKEYEAGVLVARAIGEARPQKGGRS